MTKTNAPTSRRFRWKHLDRTWKVSVSAVAVHVYRSPRGLFVTDFGRPDMEFGSKGPAMKRARQLAGRYRLRVLSE